MHCSYLTVAGLPVTLKSCFASIHEVFVLSRIFVFWSVLKLCCALLCSFPKVNGIADHPYLHCSSNVVKLAPLLATTVETRYQYFSVLLEKCCLCIQGQFNTETFYLIKDCLLLLKWIIQSFSCILGRGWSLMYWQWREITIMPWKIIENKHALFQLWQSILGVKCFLFGLPHLFLWQTTGIWVDERVLCPRCQNKPNTPPNVQTQCIWGDRLCSLITSSNHSHTLSIMDPTSEIKGGGVLARAGMDSLSSEVSTVSANGFRLYE